MRLRSGKVLRKKNKSPNKHKTNKRKTPTKNVHKKKQTADGSIEESDILEITGENCC